MTPHIKPEPNEYYWLQLEDSNSLVIGKWHGTGYWIAGNDLRAAEASEHITIVAKISKPK